MGHATRRLGGCRPARRWHGLEPWRTESLRSAAAVAGSARRASEQGFVSCRRSRRDRPLRSRQRRLPTGPARGRAGGGPWHGPLRPTRVQGTVAKGLAKPSWAVCAMAAAKHVDADLAIKRGGYSPMTLLLLAVLGLHGNLKKSRPRRPYKSDAGRLILKGVEISASMWRRAPRRFLWPAFVPSRRRT